MTIYTKECKFLILDKRQKMYVREFMFMEVTQVSKRVGDDGCKNCLVETRKKIKEFFDYADCS